jgi:hypothetical protein
MTLVNEKPEWFEFPRLMEQLHAWTGRAHITEPARFFRGGKSVAELIEMAKEPFEPFYDGHVMQPGLFGPLDEAGACSESCDIYAD